MKKTMHWILLWIKPMRIGACLGAFLGTLASWGIAYSRIDSLAIFTAFACFWTAVCTMVQNNWSDRKHDALKTPKEDFALKNERAYFWYLLLCWTAEMLVLVRLSEINTQLGLLITCQALLGFSYSIARKITGLSAVIVAVTSALCTVTPAMVGKTNHQMWCFLAGTGCWILAREQYKDIKDLAADLSDGYKRTIATAAGPHVARLVARFSLVLGSLLFLTMPLTLLPKPAAWSGLVCLSMLSSSAYAVMNSFRKAEKLLDSGFAIFILLLNGSYRLLLVLEPARTLSTNSYFCVLLLLTYATLALRRPEAIIRILETGLDQGEEMQAFRSQSRLLWPLMYGLFWVTMFTARVIATRELTMSDIADPVTAATAITAVLVAIITARTPHARIPGRSRGCSIITLFSIGVVISFFFSSHDTFGLPLPLMGFIVPFVSIVQPRLEPLCALLRSHGCLLGMIATVAIMKGMTYVFYYVCPVYLVIVVIYYAWRLYRQVPVYFNSESIIGQMMTRFGFVNEEVAT